MAADLAERAGCNRLTEAVRNSFGGLDLVISCVGVAPLRMLADNGDEHWQQVLTTNVVSTPPADARLRAASFMEAFTALGPDELGTDELGTDQGETDG